VKAAPSLEQEIARQVVGPRGRRGEVDHRRRLAALTASSLLLFGGLGLRLLDLTVRRHAELRTRAERRMRRVEVLPARRGPILDRRGRPLAIDRPVHDVAVSLPEVDPALSIVTPLARALRVTRPESLARVRDARRRAASVADPAELVPVARVPLPEADRTRLLLRRVEGLALRIDPDGLAVLAPAGLLRARDATLARFAPLIDCTPAELARALDAEADRIHGHDEREERIVLWSRPLVVVADAPFALRARVTERAFELPGVSVRQRFERTYPQGETAGHLVGYLGQPTPDEARRDRDLVLDRSRDALGLLLGERTTIEPELRLRDEPYGRRGVERTHDARLRGTPGARVLVRDARNRTRDVLRDIAPVNGEPLRLTIDVALQGAVEAALDEAVAARGDPESGGAAAVIDVRTGDLLALASAPRFDPNLVRAVYGELLDDPRKPLIHRGVMAFTPGSTWKVLNAFAITDPADPEALPVGWRTDCGGRLFSRTPGFRCDGVHPNVGLVTAVERSCNVFFFRAADRVGLSALARWAGRFGLGEPLVGDLGGEQGGVVPAPGYKLRRAAAATASVGRWAERHSRALAEGDPAAAERTGARLARAAWWARSCADDRDLRPGDVRNAIIGQGDVLATPIQVAWIAAVVASGGSAPRPRIDRDAEPRWHHVDLDPAVLRRVRRGMRRCVTRGTASSPQVGLLRLDAAGKTGTAERRKDQPNLAWFMGYYPTRDPAIAFAVIVDRTHGHGGGVCGPVARRAIEAWEAVERGEDPRDRDAGEGEGDE